MLKEQLYNQEVEKYPLTSYQKDVWTEQCLYKNKPIYNIGGYVDIKGNINYLSFQKAVQKLIGDNDSLRIRIEEHDGKPFQKVLKKIEYKVPFYDFSSKEYSEKFSLQWMQEEFLKPFDFNSNDNLFEIVLIKVNENRYFYFSRIHHIISDGWGHSIIVRELVSNYNEIDNSQNEIEKHSYLEFIRDNKSYRESDKYLKDREFWKDKFKCIPQNIFVRNIKSNKLVFSNRESVTIKRNTYNQIMEYCTKEKCSVFHFFLGVLGTYFSRVSNSKEVVIGVPILNRTKASHKQIVGHFANVIPLKIEVSKKKSFLELMNEIKMELKACYRHQKLSFGEIYTSISKDRDQKLFDITLSYENHNYAAAFNGTKTDIKTLSHRHERNALAVFIREFDEDKDVEINFDYAIDAFEKFIPIENVVTNIKHLVENIIKDSDKNINDIDVVTDREKHRLLVEFNDTKADYPRNKTINELFEKHAEKAPDDIAVVYEDKKMSYKELNERANSLARALREKGVGKDVIVGMLVERSVNMIVGIMGILKAGGAYMPIDPDYPEDRIEYTLENSKATIVLTQDKFKDKIKNKDIKICDINNEEFYKYSSTNLGKTADSNSLAYIIYTSGTTGKPKGVMIEHNNVVRLMFNDKMPFDFSNKDIWTMFHSYCFDFSVWEMYGALLYGGRLIVVPKIVAKDSEKYLELLKKEKVTVLNQTPSAFYNLMNIEANSDERKLNLRYIVFGGEALNPQKLSKWKQKYEETKIINMYGITETTVHVTFKEITSEDIEKGVSNIGKPIPTLTTYVMNKDLKIQPIGIAGELCVGGDGVARGYLNNEKLTAERFVKNPYNLKEKIYRSGDLVRVLPDGNMEYIGRIDHQVKIRGFRIELGEIENRLLKIEGIKETVVLAKGEVGSKYLCAYYVGEKEYTVGELREELKKSLPDYMVPAYFIKLESMPLTPNGKVDRKVLPEPQGKINTGAEYEAPRNELEEKLVEIWQNVLGVTNIGINDDFFELGGHSLNATTLIGRIYKKLNVEIPLREIFSKGNIKGLSEYIEAISKKEYEEIERVDEKQYYEASSAQKRTYMLQEIDKDSTVYNMPGALEIEGRFEIDRMQEAFIKLINRHETLRTSFYLKDGKIVQRINKANEIQFKIEKIEIKNEEEVKEKFEEFIRPFDLEKAPLLRVGIIKLEKERHIMFFDMHHIVSDGVSIAILTREISDLYAEKDLGELKIQYKDYSAWQLKKNESEELKKQEQYWLKEFSDEVPVLSLPTDYKRPKVKDFKGRSINFVLDKETTEKLRKIAKETGSTMYMVLLANINILLSKYSGQEDIVVGSPIAGRNHADLENLIGMFVNTLAIRSIVNNDLSFSNYLKIVRNKALKAYENQDYQFEEIVDKIDIDRDLGRNPLFDVMFVLENMEEYKIEIENSIFKPYKLTGGIEKFDITIDAREVKDEIRFNLSYATSLYKYETIKRMINHFLNIVKETTSNEEIKIKDIEILSEEERSILGKFNDTEGEYPEGKVVSELFEMQVEKTPDNIAVVYENQSLTYKELNERANSLGRTLREKGVGAESVVGIMVKRSLEMIVGIMGILKAGGAYMPIDPEYPDDRIEYMLENSETKLVLVQNEFKDRINKNNVEVCRLNDEELYKESNANLGKTASAKNLAYVIYTSGTTGKPKGVMIEHKGIVNRINWMQKKYNISSKDVILQKTTYTFDVSVWEILWWSFVGAQVRMLVPGGEKDPSEITKSIKEGKVTVLHFVPSMLNVFMDYVISEGKVEDIESLEKVFTSGEALKVEQANIFNKEIGRVNNTRLINLYGPTEASVDVTYYECREKEEMIPIGKPIDNTKIYIVDKNNKMLPIGVAGELCISGCGVARGYLNNEKLTNEKFAENPYEPGERMYRTGDLARWLPDGNIEYLGRIDHQVKIRGFRIELGEIESNILKLEGIKETIVLARDGAVSKYLCAYYVGEKEYSVGKFREELKKSMPDYMVPAYFIKLESMPLTLNGKINRKALPEPQGKIDTGSEYEAPRNEIEQKLVQIWEDVLGVQDIGINDNFFELGGHSLKATTLVGRIYKVLNVEVPLKEIFSKGNIKVLSEYIDSVSRKEYEAIEKVEEKEYYEASSAQKRMYMLQELDKNSTAYNMPGTLEILGDFDIKRMQEAFIKLIERHEVLRTSFYSKGDKIVQKITKIHEMNFEIEQIEVKSEEEVEKKFQKFIRPFELDKVPLLRAGIIKLEEKRHVMFFDMHHIVSDGVSMSILTREFSDLYAGKELGELKVQYKDYSAWQLKKRESEDFKKQEEYWLKEFSGEIPVLNLPTDYKRPKVKEFSGSSINFVLDKETTERLREIAKETGSTMYMVLMANINILLSKYSGQEDIIIGSPIAGRSHVDLENVIGMFVNTLAIRSNVNGEASFKEYLKTVKSKALKAFENQEYQFEELVDKIDVDRDLSRNPLFDIVFVLQNMEEAKIKIKDLTFKPYDINDDIEKFDMTMMAVEGKEEIYFKLSYATSIYKEETIERMINHFLNIVKVTVRNIEVKLKDIEIVSEEEKRKLLVEFNDTSVEYSKDKTITELFEEQVERTPKNTAVVFKDEKLTYKELNEKANSLARVIAQKGICQDDIVGIMVENSIDMIVGIMAILKAGGAYLPIDPEYPEDRIEYMLENSKTNIVLTKGKLKEKIAGDKREIYDLDNEELYKESKSNLGKTSKANNLAYVIYTSGTTGKPKGVMMEHKGLVNLSLWHNRYYEVTEEDRVTKYAGVGFDASVWEIFPYIIAGAAIHVIYDSIRLNIQLLNDYYEKNKITISFLPTQIFEQFIQQKNQSLRKLLTGADRLKVYKEQTYELINNYGPTENAVVTTSFRIDKEYRNIPIGRPIDNVRIYIVDENNKLLPIGVAGELCVSGDGLARGYINNEELTKEKFVANPYESGQRMYRTGDLARWLPNGNIEYLGRIDHQVKIRGFRIELGEIENNLLKLEEIKEVVVLAREKEENKYLCAYYVGEKEYNISEVREELKRSLPDYMIPAYFIKLESMPLTPNGKVDRKALPEPDGKINTGVKYEAPRNELEKQLVEIWEDVLGVCDIGINDNFFEIGGHSLKATTLIGRIYKNLNIEVPLKEIFTRGSIKGLSEYIESINKKEYEAIERVEEQECYEASSAQKRMYMLQELDKYSTAYNVPGSLEVLGKFEIERMQETFIKLIERHETLRTSFYTVDNKIVQMVNKASEIQFEIEKIKVRTEEEIQEKIKEFIRPFDLGTAPLLRAAVIKLEEERYIMLFDMHHIVSDGVSMSILTKEFSKLYSGKDLGELKVQYKDYSAWQLNKKASEEYKRQEEYWLQEFSREIPVLKLPTDYARPKTKDFKGDSISFVLDKETTESLRNIAKKTETTMYMVLLANINVLLSKYSEQEDIVVGSPIAGRNHVDLENLIGVFVNTLAIRSHVNSGLSFKEYLKTVKNKALKAYENQDYQFEELASKVEKYRDLSRNPLFDVMFVLENVGEAKIEVEDLTFKPYILSNKMEKLDITIAASEGTEEIKFNFSYATSLYKRETMEDMIKCFKHIIKVSSSNLDIAIKDISVMTNSEAYDFLSKTKSSNFNKDDFDFDFED